jgi:mono/diheme cytochrome c family protein
MLSHPRQRPVTTAQILARAGLGLCLTAIAGAASAQPPFGGGFPQQSGEEIYQGVCQGCHMPDARGAVGAGAYPALAGDKKLASKLYPVLVLVRGQKAMPEFGTSMSDEQIANVANYIRTNFGNSYADAVSPDDVKKIRGAAK